MCAYVQCKDGVCVVWWRARVACVYVVEDTYGMCGTVRCVCDQKDVDSMMECLWYVAASGGCLESIQD